ncbi:MAG: response regulator, partial [Lentisphaerae bacterium]|nr:response regulator [Lentisphaerota bacterium]
VFASRLRRRLRRTHAYYALLQSEQEQQSRQLAGLQRTLQQQAEVSRFVETAYRALLADIRDMAFVMTITHEGLPGPFLEVNDTFCRKLDYPRDKLLTLSLLDIEDSDAAAMPGFTRAQLVTVSDDELQKRRHTFAVRDAQAFWKRVREEKCTAAERVFVTRDGGRIPVEMTATLLDLPGEPRVLCTACDLSGRQETERALRASRSRFQDIFSNSPIGMALYDGTRELLMVNRACLNMFGMPDRGEFAGFNVFDNPFLTPPVRQALQRGDSYRYNVTIDFARVRDEALFVTSKSGKSHFDIQVTNLGLDADYQPQGYLVQVQDISKRVDAETALRRSERQLRQAQKMQAIGTLAGGIAHDFNNILTPILGYTEMTLYSAEKNSPVREYMQEVLKASNRARELVNQILTFSRQSEKEGHPIHVIPIAKEVVKLMAASVGPNIEIARAIKTEKDVVLADPTQIHQVLMNLCTNAAQAMSDGGGTLEIRLMDFVIGSRAKSEFPQLDPGRYLRISVKDEGTGMTAETLERIFEPFFTTKEGGKGTGMGLSVVHGIVSSLHGTITVDSTPGRGSVFHVILPLLDEPQAAEKELDTTLPSGHECVLFVDDNAEINRMVERMLVSLKYRAVIADSAEGALALFSRNPARFDIVITDQIMPGITGLELARKLLSIREDTPIVLCTGYSEAVSRAEMESAGIRGFLTKPISMQDLAKAVRLALDNAPGEWIRIGAGA